MSREVRYFGPRREPAALVTDFGELRTGMVVWTARCNYCGCDHRLLLLNPDVVITVMSAGSEVRAFDIPGLPCEPGEACISEVSVRTGRVFAVIDEPPAKAESRTRRRKLVTS